MKAVHPALKLSIAALILITIAALIAVIIGDSAKDDSYHIVMYIMMMVLLGIGVSNLYSGFQQLQETHEKEPFAAWYKQSRLLFGIFLLLCLLAWLSLNGIGSRLPYAIQSVASTIVLVVLGIPALAVIIFTMRNRSRL